MAKGRKEDEGADMERREKRREGEEKWDIERAPRP